MAILLAALLVPAFGTPQQEGPRVRGRRDWEAGLKVIGDHCSACHRWAQSPEGILTKVTPGDPEKSDLYEAVVGGVMPPGGPLHHDEIGSIREWIRVGAPTTPEEFAAIEAALSVPHPRNPHRPPRVLAP